MKNEGFSILELCIALALLAIVSGAFISTSRLGDRYEIKRFLASTGRMIQTTATAAIRSGGSCHISISNVKRELLAECQNSSPNPKRLTLPARIQSITPMFGGADSSRLNIYANGVFSPGSLLVEQGSYSCLLSLSLYGSQKVSCS